MEVLYEDDHIVVINKPTRMLSVPGKTKALGDSATTVVANKYGEIHVVHRLDCETSGIMVFARHKEALRHLHKQFHDRRTEKTYIAVVDGIVKPSTGEVDLPLICDWPNRPKQKVCYDTGKPSNTQYEVIEPGNRQTRIRLTPITGRSHQLRVHMAELGHPILGDSLYAPDEVKKRSVRLCLHASMLAFEHPDSGEWLTFHCEPDF